jgi:hypothetical protein
MCGMTSSAQVLRINQLYAVYLHKLSGARYYIADSLDGFHELHELAEAGSLSGSYRYVSDAALQDPELWSREILANKNCRPR